MRARLTILVGIAVLVVAGCGGSTSSTGGPDSDSFSPATVEFVALPSLLRLTPHVDVTQPDAAESIVLDAARGEREGGQLVAWASQGEPRVVLEVGELRAASGDRIAAKHVHPYIQHAMTVKQGSPNSRAGTYVDPLIPARDRSVVLGSDQRLLAWIDVTVPVDTTPATYEGEVRIRRADKDGRTIGSPGDALANIPVTVRVHRTTLPKVPTLESHIGFDQSQLVRFEGVQGGTTALRDVTERYARLLADSRLSIADVGALPPGALPGHAGLPGDDEYLRRVFDQRGVASVRIPFYMDYPFADPLGRDRAAAVRYLRASAAWARREGWGDRAHVFAIDEPDVSRAGEVRELHELVKEADPRLRLLVTKESSAREFRGSVDIWAPNINPKYFHRADVVREARAGRETWWYPSITTWQPYPTLFIDELRPTPRALGWLAWQQGVRGFLYWSATHWQEVEDPFRDPGTYNETDVVGNGDGVLLYPGGPIGMAGTPIPSVRLLQLRDGIEDHDLLVAASCVGTATQRDALRRAARELAPALDRIEPTAAGVEYLRSSAFRILDRTRNAADCRTTAP